MFHYAAFLWFISLLIKYLLVLDCWLHFYLYSVVFCWPNDWSMNGENWIIDNENSPPACQAVFFIFEGSKTNQNVLNKATFLVFYATSLGISPQTKSILWKEDFQAWNCDYLLTRNRHVHKKARSRTHKWHHRQHRDVDWCTHLISQPPGSPAGPAWCRSCLRSVRSPSGSLAAALCCVWSLC